jgi:hypothetical protein
VLRLIVIFVFALLFTGITIRLALGGLDAPVFFAAAIAIAFWWRVLVGLKRGVRL